MSVAIYCSLSDTCAALPLCLTDCIPPTQIMVLESIISAYTLSALTLNNARSSERQLMVRSQSNTSITCLRPLHLIPPYSFTLH